MPRTKRAKPPSGRHREVEPYYWPDAWDEAAHLAAAALSVEDALETIQAIPGLESTNDLSRLRLAFVLPRLVDHVWKPKPKSFDSRAVSMKLQSLAKLAEDLLREATELTDWFESMEDTELLERVQDLRESIKDYGIFLQKPRSRGKPKGKRKRPDFDRFVCWVYEGARREGIKLTISSDEPSGTLVALLRKLKVKLPPGFVPNTLNASTLRRAIKFRYRYPLDPMPWDLESPPPVCRTK